jgi:inner membrane protein
MKKESAILRILLISAIVILLLVPNFMIQSLITERHQYRLDAINEIGKSWAGAQIVAGPVISLTKKKERKDKNGDIHFIKESSHYLPEKLEINAEVQPEIRYKGIYELVLYKSKIKMKGHINLSKLRERFTADDFDEIYISFNVSDLRGMQKDVKLKLNGKDYNLIPGLKNKIFRNGFYANIQLDKDTLQNFEIDLDLNGMENLEFIPLGKYSEININSSWNNPSFLGAFLPESRKIKEDGFNAKWIVNYFNRTYPQEWQNINYDVFPSAFGVKLLIPVDEYQKTMRMSKYSLMIIVLTFLSFFLVEVFSKKVIHPIQYLLVGLALIIFYSILLAISEYVVFQYSYLISSLMTILLIGFYVNSIYRSKQIASIVTGMLAMFYGFMYVILQLQDYSLLLGNIALFIILALVMFFTRKVNWYDVFSSNSKSSG